VTGRVLFQDGSGVEGAKVALDVFSTVSDAEGEFELELDAEVAERSVRGSPEPLDSADALMAWFEGWAPALVPGYGEIAARALEGGVELAPVELVLVQRAQDLRGMILERTGVPAVEWRVALLGGEVVSVGESRPFTAEELASGITGHRTTGLDGGFEFRGLRADTEYRVRGWNPRTLEQVTSEPVVPGTHDLVLRAPAAGWRARVDGVVVGLDGLPLGEVWCRLSMNEYRTEGGAWMTSGQVMETDASGRFAFTEVPPGEIFVRFGGYGSSTELELLPEREYRDVRIELVRSGDITFESSDPAPDGQRSVAVLDEEEKELTLTVPLTPDFGQSTSSSEFPLMPEGTLHARVSERARWLVVREGERELARLPLVVRHGADARVRW
jgi:hypothetical protein